MTFRDALELLLLLLANLGGAVVVVYGLSAWLGTVWASRIAENHRAATEQQLTQLRGDLDQRLARLDASLQHHNVLLQRLADIELQGIQKCWRLARRAHLLLNGVRPEGIGNDVEGLDGRLRELETAHNRLLAAIGSAEPFLIEGFSGVLHEIARLLRLELSQARRDHFSLRWWEQGEENRRACQTQIDGLRAAIQLRVIALRHISEPTRNADSNLDRR